METRKTDTGNDFEKLRRDKKEFANLTIVISRKRKKNSYTFPPIFVQDARETGVMRERERVRERVCLCEEKERESVSVCGRLYGARELASGRA